MSLVVWRSSCGDDAVDVSGNAEEDGCKPRHFHSPRVLPSRAAVFSAGGHLSPWVPMLLLLGGDVETNPGPTTYTCKTNINKRQTSIQCNNRSKHWIHLKCSGIQLKEYNQTFTCSLHSDQDTSTNSDLSSTSDTSTATEHNNSNHTPNSNSTNN